jgi:hypothetical protein
VQKKVTIPAIELEKIRTRMEKVPTFNGPEFQMQPWTQFGTGAPSATQL